LTRPFDKHLDSDELDRLVPLQRTSGPDSGQPSEQSLGEAQRHVESCQDCSRKLQLHRSVQSKILRMRALNPSPPAPECIGYAEWLEVAAGLYPDAETRELMKHAAQCGHCGPLLKNAAEALFDETTPSEEAWLASLRSARPEWRKNMAEALHDGTEAKGGDREKKEGTQWWQTLFSWPRPVFAVAGGAVVVVAGWLGMRVLYPPSAEQLLAQAYAEHRTLEVRIPGAKYAPMRVERAIGGSSLDKPPSLLNAEALIGENLRKNPNDPAWLQAKARADLLDGNYESAIKSLQRALETQPDDPGLLTDLGSAYFVRAEAADRPIDYGNAIESLGKALAKSPDDPVALFNRALACERMFLYTQAVDDWEHYLRIDPRGEWAEDARKHLAAVKQKVEQHEKSQNEPLLTPSEIARAGPDDASVREKIDERIEEYLHVAVAEWLPRAYPAIARDGLDASDFRAALRVLAEITEQKHRDHWLKDILAVTSSRYFSDGVAVLARSIASNEKGDFVSAEGLATEAEQKFLSASNDAGILRARYERVYALHLAQEGALCLRAVAGFPRNIDSSAYRWLRIQLRLEEGTCRWIVGNLGSADQSYRIALKEAENSGYVVVYLRAVNHVAGIESASGNELSSWARARRGLEAYWSSKVPAMQGYNLYFDLHEVADWTHEPYLDVVVWNDAVSTIDSTQDVVLRAAAHSYLGNAAANGEMPELAEHELQKASDIFAAAPQDRPTRIARIEAEARLAQVEVLQGQTSRAYDRLSALKPEISSISDNLLALIFYRALGEAEFQRGSLQQADAALRAAITLAERNVKSLQGEDTRLRWADEARSAYRDLTELMLRGGDSQQALEIWEWYRGAALRHTRSTSLTALPSPAKLANGPPLPRLNRVASRMPAITTQSILSYAVFNDGVEVWAYDSRGMTSHWIAIPLKELRRRAVGFRILCSDPNSNTNYLHSQARALYDLFISPAEQTISPGRTLVVETDDVLDDIPFEFLVDKENHFLVERVPLVSSLGLYYDDALRPDMKLSNESAALVSAVASSDIIEGENLPPLPDTESEARTVAAMFRSPALLIGNDSSSRDMRAQLGDVSIFHFAGHAVASANHAGLLLSDGLLDDSWVRLSQFSKLQLAVLSACETEHGTGDSASDPNSLVRSFMRAGVPHVVASRWRVDSVASRMFMQAFYEALLQGKSVSSSIQAAQVGLKEHPGFEHPYFWAAFRAFGRS
jgi:CHAT domain-containing protein/tetratricopeptide (TPR) repeat protein